MPSFDIVSEIETAEIRNAAENANRILTTRYDFKGVEASFDYQDDTVKVAAEGDYQVTQMLEMFRTACVKRGIDLNALQISDLQHSGKTYSKTVSFVNGIDKDTAKKIVKTIKESKAKVQAAIQGEQVRVTGKKRDDLQGVMALLRESEVGIPLQFNNFRD